MEIVFSGPLVLKKFVPRKDNETLRTILQHLPENQNAAHVTYDGVTIADRFIEPTFQVVIEPPFPDEFSTKEVIDILELARSDFGPRASLQKKLRGRLHEGVMLTRTETGVTTNVSAWPVS